MRQSKEFLISLIHHNMQEAAEAGPSTTSQRRQGNTDLRNTFDPVEATAGGNRKAAATAVDNQRAHHVSAVPPGMHVDVENDRVLPLELVRKKLPHLPSWSLVATNITKLIINN
jgi:hypothetical protein